MFTLLKPIQTALGNLYTLAYTYSDLPVVIVLCCAFLGLQYEGRLLTYGLWLRVFVRPVFGAPDNAYNYLTSLSYDTMCQSIMLKIISL